MKYIFAILYGVVIQPVALILFFSFANWILSCVPFLGTFHSIQNSEIWILWSIVIIICSITWFVWQGTNWLDWDTMTD